MIRIWRKRAEVIFVGETTKITVLNVRSDGAVELDIDAAPKDAVSRGEGGERMHRKRQRERVDKLKDKAATA